MVGKSLVWIAQSLIVATMGLGATCFASEEAERCFEAQLEQLQGALVDLDAAKVQDLVVNIHDASSSMCEGNINLRKVHYQKPLAMAEGRPCNTLYFGLFFHLLAGYSESRDHITRDEKLLTIAHTLIKNGYDINDPYRLEAGLCSRREASLDAAVNSDISDSETKKSLLALIYKARAARGLRP